MYLLFLSSIERIDMVMTYYYLVCVYEVDIFYLKKSLSREKKNKENVKKYIYIIKQKLYDFNQQITDISLEGICKHKRIGCLENRLSST